ncbi:MAG: prepilin peptidase [Calditrichaeota bacterium]|nr:prepilin peptidase [Calditrichota bacterium]
MSEAFVILIGLAFGSFLNVCAYRIPRKKTLLFSRSQCPNCGHTIPFYYNIPVLSFILLKGKCRYCGEKISFQYPIVELFTAFITWALFVNFGLTAQTLFYAVFVYSLIVIAVIDIKTHLILNKVLIVVLVLGLLINFFGRVIPFIDALLGAVIGGGVMFLVAILGNRIFKQEAMGMGDVKLALVSGFFLGWKLILWSLYIGFVIALLSIGVIWIIKKKSVPRHIPMGPFFASGFILNLFYGQQLFEWYLGLFS